MMHWPHAKVLPHYGSPYACIEPHGQRIAAMIRKSQFRSTCVPFEWKWLSLIEGISGCLGHRVSKSLGHRREDLSRTILSARRKNLAPQRERTTSGRAKVADGKRDFVVPTGTDCFVEGLRRVNIRNGCGGLSYIRSCISDVSTNGVGRATRTNIHPRFITLHDFSVRDN